ncbi:MFS general substrate transporter [Hypoxylon sp. EC38]|nr:MFS general substrate transporter [Hypoxylon sp. EC38]
MAGDPIAVDSEKPPTGLSGITATDAISSSPSSEPVESAQNAGFQHTESHPPPRQKHSLRFWVIILALSLLAFISALDTMIVTTALPTITKELGGAAEYIWIGNSFVFASSVLQPLVGQLADILGRKIPTTISILFFLVGSGIAGGANNSATFIAGRTVQGIGAGGIYVLIDIVCCDLVSLRDRGKYLGIVNAWAGVAAALGPVLGGVLTQVDWRWIFWMNIPICVLPLVPIALFLPTKRGNLLSRLRTLDYLGTAIFIPSVIAVLFGLVAGGVQYPWSSWRVILTLVLGFLGWVAFHVQQHFASHPSVPTRLFSNRTSAIGFALTFLGSVALQTLGYFLPVYFQAVLTTSVRQSGINFLPVAIGCLFFAAIAGISLSVLSIYKPIHAIAFGLSILGYGLFTLLDESTSTVAWAFFEIIAAGGLGMTISAVLPAILAGLSPDDVASATATFSFIKTFGFIWGVTVPSVIFNSAINKRLRQISSLSLQDQLRDGGAYSFASQARLISATLDSSLWSEVVNVYVESLKPIWWFGLALSVLAFLLVFLEKELPLSKELTTEYGLEENKQSITNENTIEA